MRYPDFLSEGGTIGFVAPSFGCATEPYKTAFGMALDKFTQLGYALDLGPNCYESKGLESATRHRPAQQSLHRCTKAVKAMCLYPAAVEN